jgi:hypothetical protein
VAEFELVVVIMMLLIEIKLVDSVVELAHPFLHLPLA